MKIINSNNVVEELRNSLLKECSARCLDNEEDFSAVIGVIEATINKWMENRCSGCK